MRYIEAILVTTIVAILLLPVLCIGVLITLVLEVVSVMQEAMSDDRFVKGIVTDVVTWYGGLIKRVFNEIVKV